LLEACFDILIHPNVVMGLVQDAWRSQSTLFCSISAASIFAVRSFVNRNMLSIFDINPPKLAIKDGFLVLVSAELSNFEFSLCCGMHRRAYTLA
jgi:hypothetical protein